MILNTLLVFLVFGFKLWVHVDHEVFLAVFVQRIGLAAPIDHHALEEFLRLRLVSILGYLELTQESVEPVLGNVVVFFDVDHAPKTLDLLQEFLSREVDSLGDPRLLVLAHRVAHLGEILVEHFDILLLQSGHYQILEFQRVFIEPVHFLQGHERNVRNLQIALEVHSVDEVLVEWLLAAEFALDVQFLIGDEVIDWCEDWLLNVFVEIVDKRFDARTVRCQTKDDHESVEVIDPQEL